MPCRSILKTNMSNECSLISFVSYRVSVCSRRNIIKQFKRADNHYERRRRKSAKTVTLLLRARRYVSGNTWSNGAGARP